MEYSWGQGTTKVILALDENLLPVHYELNQKGTPTEGELAGFSVTIFQTLDYSFEPVSSFSDADFVLEKPDNISKDNIYESATYELSPDNPKSEQATWKQYWLYTGADSILVFLADAYIGISFWLPEVPNEEGIQMILEALRPLE